MRNINPIATNQYIEKADHFLQGMKRLGEDAGAYRTGIGLLAVHSAISLTDAIMIGSTGSRGKYQDHLQSARALEDLCQSSRVRDLKGVNHLRWLLTQKNAVAYEHRRLDDASLRMAMDKAEKFSAGLTIASRRFCVLNQTLSPARQEARAKNAVAEFLFRQLIVPKVFLEARWRGKTVDVLAVDRSGAGDIHVVDVCGLANVAEATASLLKIPAHFKYLALFGNRNYGFDPNALYAANGMGRIGVIQVTEDRAGNLSAAFYLRPERFRLDPSYLRMIDKFVATRPADLEVRP